MIPKVTPQDLANAATVDNLVRNNRKLREDLEAADVREATLLGALESIPKIHVLPLWQYRSQLETWWWHTRKDALADPSPIADAAVAVIEAAVRWCKNDGRVIDVERLVRKIYAYLALRDGRADGGE